MKEQKTISDLISYYEEELKYTNKSINDTEIENACERERESNYKLFLSQLKQLKEDNPYQKKWEKLEQYLIDNRMRAFTSDEVRFDLMYKIDELEVDNNE